MANARSKGPVRRGWRSGDDMNAPDWGTGDWTGVRGGRLSAGPGGFQAGGVVGPGHELPVLDDLAVPGKDDETGRLEGMVVGAVRPGLERYGGPDLARP